MPSKKHAATKPRGRDTGKASRPAPARATSRTMPAAAPRPQAVAAVPPGVEQSHSAFAGPAAHSMGYFSQGDR